MKSRLIVSFAAVLLAGLTGACTSASDPMSMLPISEQAYLRTQVPSQPSSEPISVEAMLQNALAGPGTETIAAPEAAADLPPSLDLRIAPGCDSPLSGEALIAIGHYRTSLEGRTGLAGRILVPAGEDNLCAFLRADDVARLLDGTLMDLRIEPSVDLAPDTLRIIAEPMA